MTVKFVDVSSRRKSQKELRKELLSLIGDDLFLWKQDNKKTRKVQEIGRMLGADSMEESRPLDAIDPNSFTLAEYKTLQNLGYSGQSIHEVLGFKSLSK